jgi:serine/threonine protein kinase/tetratricopeptide (TPR) repeat protein
MTPESWEHPNPAFLEAAERSPSERKAFIAAASGDHAQHREQRSALVEEHQPHDTAGHSMHVVPKRNTTSAGGTELAPGALVLGRFQIIRWLGSGGMGDVYEAFDSELAHVVALKLIKPEIATNEAVLARFKKEVQIARRLNGPNICRIHELFVFKDPNGCNDGAFITMEFLDGGTLADVLKHGPLSGPEAKLIALDICAALTTIHSAGIVHRDLKSRNIMLVSCDGRRHAVVMDFGLAHELSASDASAETALTVPGAFLGTPDYCAPEQLHGGGVTPATDIYALGIVLFELTTGKRPFAPSSAALGAGRPVAATSADPGMPHRWSRVIQKCLEFEPSNRFHSAAKVARALRLNALPWPVLRQRGSIPFLSAVTFAALLAIAWLVPPIRERFEGVAFASHEKHIAVLPFEVSDNDHAAEVLGDGLMDSLSGQLSNLDRANHTFWVIPSSEVRRRKVGDPRSALREFGATIVIKGYFSRIDHILRLNLELIDTRRMREIGFARIDTREEDLAALQDEAIVRLGRLMNIAIPGNAPRAQDVGVDRTSYENYIAALGYLERYDKPGNLDKAIAALGQSVRAAPRFGAAFEALGRAYTLQYKMDANTESLEQARQSLDRARALDDKIPTLHAALAALDRIDGRYDQAAREFQLVLRLQPGNVEALNGLAELDWKTGKLEDAERAYLEAASMRPDDWQSYNLLGNFYDDIGRHKDAIAQFEHALALTPDNAYAYCNLAGAYINAGDPALLPDAERALNDSISLNPSYEAYANLGGLYGAEQRFQEAADATEKALQLNDENFEVWNNLLQYYEALGNGHKASLARKRTLALVEKALAVNSKNFEARSLLASLDAKESLRPDALRNIRAALMLAPRDQTVLSNVADAYECLGEHQMAVRYLHRALQNGYPVLEINPDIYLRRVFADPSFHGQRSQTHSQTQPHT